MALMLWNEMPPGFPVVYRVPNQMKAIPSRIRVRSTTFAFRFLSLKIITPHANEIITELLRTSDTTEIIESGSLREVKYAKSARHMNMDISGMDHFQRNGVLRCRDGHQMSPQTSVMMTIW